MPLTVIFILSPKEQAYGEHDPKSVLALDKETFMHDGVFDTANIYKDAIVPLQNEQGQRFLGRFLTSVMTRLQ